eukprot:5579407-Prymnesium_polylepis.1
MLRRCESIAAAVTEKLRARYPCARKAPADAAAPDEPLLVRTSLGAARALGRTRPSRARAREGR